MWEESEFWIALSWKIDPDGALGIRKYFESPYRPGEKITVDEYYGWMFEHSVPGLPEAAAKEDLTPLQYMRRYGAFKVDDVAYSKAHEQPVESGGVVIDGVRRAGFNTPSRKLEFYSPTLAEWGWPEHAIPRYVPGHVYWRDLDRERERVRSAAELPAADADPHPLASEVALRDLAQQPAVDFAGRCRQARPRRRAISSRCEPASDIFVTRAWITEGIRPGVVGMSHHLGTLAAARGSGRRPRGHGTRQDRARRAGRYTMRQVHGAQPFASDDPEASRIWWSEVGVHQNLTFPVQPDPVSGMHCWHQKREAREGRPGRSLRRHHGRHQRVTSALQGMDGERHGRRPDRMARDGRCGSIGR